MIKVLFFATLKDRAGTRETEIDVPGGTTIEQLKALISEKYPSIRESLGHCLTAVNHHYQTDDYEIPAGAEVALFPPVSGG